TTPQRRGEYQQSSIDTDNDKDVWAVNEYCNAMNSWAVHITKLLAPPPASLASALPATISSGLSSVNVVINGTSVNGSGFFDPGINYSKHIAATVTGGVTVSQVVFNNPAQITLTISTVGASAGLKTVTVTNPD